MLTREDKKLIKQNTESMWTYMEQCREIAALLFGDPCRSHADILEEIKRLKVKNES